MQYFVRYNAGTREAVLSTLHALGYTIDAHTESQDYTFPIICVDTTIHRAFGVCATIMACRHTQGNDSIVEINDIANLL